jgi:hypothetical protein
MVEGLDPALFGCCTRMVQHESSALSVSAHDKDIDTLMPWTYAKKTIASQ